MTRAAAIQMTSGPDVEANLRRAAELIERASGEGASLVALPENFAFMGLADHDKRTVAETPGSGPIQAFLESTARRLKVWIVGGTIPLRKPLRERGAQPGRVAAASLVYDAAGHCIARYDKIHLFDVDIPGKAENYRESAHVEPGGEPAIVETPIGRLGLTVCYDVRFPELFRSLGALGAQAFVLPSAFTVPTGEAHWETLVRARAIENLAFMIAPAQTGTHASGRRTYGDSMIVDHWGQILARLPQGEGSIIAELDLAAQLDARERFPALRHRVL